MKEVAHSELVDASPVASFSFQQIAPSVLSWWSGLAAQQKSRMFVGMLGAIALLALLSFWAFRPSWSILYSGLSPDEARQIAVVLSAANLTYEVSKDGTVLSVPAEQLDKARLATASKASGKSGRLGFELFDKPDWAGSDFDEKVNFQRALEGELERTIDSISDVQSSSVHLVLPHDSLFTSAQRDAKASVIIRLKSRRLSQTEAESVKALVANAVDDLSSENVVLADAEGRALGGKDSASDSRDAYERSLTDHILQALEPLVGVGNVHAVVNVDYDSSTRDIVNEDYDPGSVVTLSMQRSEQLSGTPPAAVGIPGTASNAPAQNVPLFPGQKSQNESSKQESGTYGASKKTEHSVQSAGSVRRISAAVVINDRSVAKSDAKAASSERAWTADEMKQLTSLVQAAVGYDTGRGDAVIVQNLHFSPQEVPKVSLFHKLWGGAFQQELIVKDVVMAVIAMSVLFFVVRPALFMIKDRAPTARLLSSSVHPVQGGTSQESLGEKESKGLLDQVVTQIHADPVQSARLLQTWIRTE